MAKILGMTCCCCGEYIAGAWKQHWNRDTGYGVCFTCVVRLRIDMSESEIVDLYGIENVNWGPPED